MAAASTRKLEELLKCPICLEVLDHPKAFECMHLFCQSCIDGLKPKRLGPRRILECPSCRQETQKDKLRSMYFVHELLEIVALAKQEQRYCDKCKDNPAKYRCTDCKEKVCKNSHDGFSFLEHHTWEQLTGDTAPVIDRHIYCTKHKGELAKLHCKDCDELICFLCKGTEHNFHQGETIDDAIQRLLPGVKKQQEHVQEMILQTEHHLSKLRTDKATVNKGYKETEKKIDQKVKEVIRKAREDGKKLKDSLAKSRAQQLQDIDKCEQELEMQLNSQQTMAALAESAITSVQGASLLQALQSGVRESLEAQTKQKQVIPKYGSQTSIDFKPYQTEKGNTVGSLERKESFLPDVRDRRRAPALPRASSVTTCDERNPQQSMFVNRSLAEVSGLQTERKRELQLGFDCRTFSIINGDLWCIEYAKTSSIHIYTMDCTKENTIELRGVEYCRRVAQVYQGLVLAARNGLFICDMDAAPSRTIITDKIRDLSVLNDRVFVLNSKTRKIQILKLGSTGSYTPEKEFGIVDYNSDYHNTLQVTSNYIYIALVYKDRVLQYRHDGTLVASHKSRSTDPNQLLSLRICGADAAGTILIADCWNHRLKSLSADGQWRCLQVQGLTEPTCDVIHDNSLFVIDSDGLKEYAFQ